MPGGRPRKKRPVEFCICCKSQGLTNKGYPRRVVSWTPGYKDTSKNYYWRFRHDDRTFFCKKCGMNECYVDRSYKKQLKEEIAKHPLADLIDEIEFIEKGMEISCKLHGKFASLAKTWKLTSEENKRCVNAFQSMFVMLDLFKIQLEAVSIEMGSC